MASMLTYRETGRFTPLVHGYVEQDPVLASLQEHPFTAAGLEMAARARTFDPASRDRLCRVLERQYEGIEVDPAVRAALDLLKRPGTLTVTTGHQLCLFTGPLYLPIKIMNAVRLARDLSRPDQAVVPVFWMASEDHDRAEIDHAWLDGVKVEWSGASGPPVGRMMLEGIDPVIDTVGRMLGEGEAAEELRRRLKEAYAPHRTLAQATRHLVNALFGRFGVVVLDGDDPDLKAAFAPLMKREALERIVLTAAKKAEALLGDRYGAQAHARDINLFHLSDLSRARIEERDGRFQVLDGTASYTPEELLDALEDRPQVFSPNVLLRPIYQESVLPNVAYVGGGAEVAYWLQLRPVFQAFGVPMPVVALRTSVILLGARERERLAQLGLSTGDLFAPMDTLRERLARAGSGINVDLDPEKREVEALFDRIAERAKAADPTLEASVRGEAQKAQRSLDHIAQKLLRAAKRDQEQALARLASVHERLLPGGALAERRDNVLPYLVRYGNGILDRLLEVDPLDKQVAVIDL